MMQAVVPGVPAGESRPDQPVNSGTDISEAIVKLVKC
jgi:hypothetical protein